LNPGSAPEHEKTHTETITVTTLAHYNINGSMVNH
jgi:hypothetical protein